MRMRRSFTGSRGAQPDGQGSEDCLAVLNNFYNVSLRINLRLNIQQGFSFSFVSKFVHNNYSVNTTLNYPQCQIKN